MKNISFLYLVLCTERGACNLRFMRFILHFISFFSLVYLRRAPRIKLTLRWVQCYLSCVRVQCGCQAHVKNIIIKIEFKRLRLQISKFCYNGFTEWCSG